MSKKQIKIIPKKVVAFDIDETIGYFIQFSIFCGVIEEYRKKQITQIEFNFLLDMFPEFLRYKILDILKYLINEKKLKRFHKLVLFTNNTGNKLWPNRIRKYFEYKLNQKIFDRTICAYKVNGKQIEKCRTSHNKKYTDLMNCIKMDYNTRVFFMDDQQHPYMYNHNVTYFNNTPYVFQLLPQLMLNRFKRSVVYKSIPRKELFDSFFLNNLYQYREFNGPIKSFTLKYFSEYNFLKKDLQRFLNKPNKNKTLKQY